MQPPGGVGQHQVGVAGGGVLDGVEDDRPGIAALVAADDRRADPVGPQLELVGGRGAERVAGGHHHPVAVADLAHAELADGGGLADAVDADEEPDVGGVGQKMELAVAVEDGGQLGLQGADEFVGVADPLLLDPAPEVVEDPGGQAGADVGQDQGLLELLPGALVDAVPGSHRGEVAGEQGAGPAQPVPHPGRGGRRGDRRWLFLDHRGGGRFRGGDCWRLVLDYRGGGLGHGRRLGHLRGRLRRWRRRCGRLQRRGDGLLRWGQAPAGARPRRKPAVTRTATATTTSTMIRVSMASRA